jgi:hypothetical protein
MAEPCHENASVKPFPLGVYREHRLATERKHLIEGIEARESSLTEYTKKVVHLSRPFLRGTAGAD